MIAVFLCVTPHNLSDKYQHLCEAAVSITQHYILGCENLLRNLAECLYWPWFPACHILNVWSFTSISHTSSCCGWHYSDNFTSTGKKENSNFCSIIVRNLFGVLSVHSHKHLCTESSRTNSLVFKGEYLIYFETCHNKLCCDTFNNSFCPVYCACSRACAVRILRGVTLYPARPLWWSRAHAHQRQERSVLSAEHLLTVTLDVCLKIDQIFNLKTSQLDFDDPVQQS